MNEPISEDVWRSKLDPQRFAVLREGATEPPFSGEYVNEKRPGRYACAGCGAELFSSDHKYDSRSGWPSFYQALDPGQDPREGRHVPRHDSNGDRLCRLWWSSRSRLSGWTPTDRPAVLRQFAFARTAAPRSSGPQSVEPTHYPACQVTEVRFLAVSRSDSLQPDHARRPRAGVHRAGHSAGSHLVIRSVLGQGVGAAGGLRTAPPTFC